MLTLKPIDCRPAYQKPVNFDRPHKNQINRSPHEKVIFGPRKKQVNFDPHTKTKWISIPHAKTKNFDLIAEIKSISIPTLIPSPFRCPDTKTGLISIQTLKTSNFGLPHKNQRNFDAYTEIKSVSTTHTTTKSISMLTLKPRDFRPPYETSQFRPPTQKPSQSILTRKKLFSARTQKTIQFRSPR